MKIVEWYGKLVDCGMDAETLLNRVEKAEKLNEKYKQKIRILKNVKLGQEIKYKMRLTACHEKLKQVFSEIY